MAEKIRYPLALQTVDEYDIGDLINWLQGNPRLTKGDLTIEFEERWAQYIKTQYSVFCNSGSSANLLAFYALVLSGRLYNKKVVVPSVGWVTTVSPVIQLGYEPIMLGADKDTFGIDMDQLEDVCRKENPSAVIFVQVLGVPHASESDWKTLKEKYGFSLIEDSCASLGSEYSTGNKVGTVGDLSTFSMYMGHQLSTIEGGMVNTDDEELYELMLMIRSHGWGKDLPEKSYNALIEKYGIDDFSKPFIFFIPGLNIRSTDLQARIGLRQVDKASWVANRRYENHLYYAELLKGVVEFQDWKANKPVSISFGAIAESTEQRKTIVQALMDNGIETRMFSAGNLGRHPFWYERYTEFRDDVSDRIHETGFFIPNYPELLREDIEYISNVIKNCIL